MQINEKLVKERLAGVPESHRSHIYDASIVLEFLAATFMPTKFFLPEGFSPTPGTPLGATSMRKVSEGKEMMLRDLYDLYLLFREEKDYTTKIESRYIFGIIVRNLRYYKNRWEFITWRVGVAQIWHVGPLVMRKDVSAEDRAKFAAKLEEGDREVEADPVNDPDEEIVYESNEGAEENGDPHGSHSLDEGYQPDRFIEVDGDFFEGTAYDIESSERFTEAGANIEPDVHSEPAPLEDY